MALNIEFKSVDKLKCFVGNNIWNNPKFKCQCDNCNKNNLTTTLNKILKWF